jgi:tetratricopeptide (TPR) repeat protein
MTRLFGLVLITVFLAGLPALAPAGVAAAAADVQVQKALADLEQENYEEALEGLTQAWKRGPHTPEKAFYLGKVHRAMLNYPQARDYLEEAVRLKPDYPEARLLLADTLIALDQIEPAQEQLRQLQASGYRPAQVAFLEGLAAVKKKQYSQAVDHFRRAQQDPALAQKAKLQMSLALAAENRLPEARKALNEAVSLGPQTQLGGFAQYYLKDLDRRFKEAGPWRFNVALGFDFDSNVTLQPGDPSAAQQVSGRGDVVFTQSGFLEYTPLTSGPFSLRTSYAFYQNFHHRLTSYDQISHTFGVMPVYNFPSSRLWVPFYFNFTDVEADKYYTAFDMNPTWLYLANSKVGLEVGGRLARQYYWFPLALPEDDRSGRTLGGSLGAYYFLKNQKGYLQARFSSEHDFASGNNWENTSYHFLFGALYPVNDRVKLNSFVDMILQPYDHRFYNGNPLALNPKRDDRILIFGVQATYEVYQGVEFNVHYYLVRADSNIALYDYTRHIVGCQIGYRY